MVSQKSFGLVHCYNSAGFIAIPLGAGPCPSLESVPVRFRFLFYRYYQIVTRVRPQALSSRAHKQVSDRNRRRIIELGDNAKGDGEGKHQ